MSNTFVDYETCVSERYTENVFEIMCMYFYYQAAFYNYITFSYLKCFVGDLIFQWDKKY